MTGVWITDIRHFLDEHGRIPHDLPPWSCPICGDHGTIYNWQDSPWDQHSPHPVRKGPPASGLAGFSPRATIAWNTIPVAIQIRLLNNFWCGTCLGNASVELKGGSVSHGDLILRGNCTRCGGAIARLVEDVGRR